MFVSAFGYVVIYTQGLQGKNSEQHNGFITLVNIACPVAGKNILTKSFKIKIAYK